MTWNSEERRAIELGMQTVVNTTTAESVTIMKGLFAGIIRESRFSDDELTRLKCIESTMLDESRPVYPEIIPPKQLVRELHVRLRAMQAMETIPYDEQRALLLWHEDICQCGNEWLWEEEQ